MAAILVVDDEPGLRDLLRVVLRREGHDVVVAENGEQALAVLSRNDDIQVVLSDLRMDGMGGIELLGEVRTRWPHVQVVVMTAFAEWDTAMRAMRAGAFNFLRKPFDNAEVRRVIHRAISAYDHQAAAEASGEHLAAVHIVGSGSAIMRVQELVDRVAASDATVLITGESGTGKELVARAVHYASHRSDGPMVRVNSGALTPNLLESELFGHVKGAFTGAVENRPGLFSLADGGTLFLDEVGELALETQVKLLRVLETGEFNPVGGRDTITCDVRVVAATNRDLKVMVESGSFREDLYYRLAVIQVPLPALRERKDDIPLLAGHLLSRHAVRLRRGVTGFTHEAMEALCAYKWPGNIRELDNRIQRGAALTPDGDIDLDALFGDVAETQTEVWRAISTSRIQRPQVVPQPPQASPQRHETEGDDYSPTEDSGELPAEAPPKLTAKATPQHTDSQALERRSSTSDDLSRRDQITDLLANGGRIDLTQTLADLEREWVAAALDACDQNLTETANHLGLSFRQIRYKVRQLGLR